MPNPNVQSNSKHWHSFLTSSDYAIQRFPSPDTLFKILLSFSKRGFLCMFTHTALDAGMCFPDSPSGRTGSSPRAPLLASLWIAPTEERHLRQRLTPSPGHLTVWFISYFERRFSGVGNETCAEYAMERMEMGETKAVTIDNSTETFLREKGQWLPGVW